MHLKHSPLADAQQSPPQLAPAQMTNVELIDWVRRSMFASGLAPRFSLRRFRWRRVNRAATRELSMRLLGHGDSSGLCQRCHDRRATSHLIRDGVGGSGFEHYCHECATEVPPGWYVVMSSEQ